MHAVRTLLALFAFVPVLAAQEPAKPPDPNVTAEQALMAFAAGAFRTYAAALEAANMNGRALEARREQLMEYSPDDAECRKKLGFAKVGDLWRRDETLPVLSRDTGDAKKVVKTEQAWEATCKDLCKRHEAMAEQWLQAGNPAGAAAHYRRVLRFQPGHAKAASYLKLQPFDGFLGTERELVMLRRSRAIRDSVQFLTSWEPLLVPMDGEQQAELKRAGITAPGIRTRHFEVWGTVQKPWLVNVARWAERSLLLSRTVFAGVDDRPHKPELMLDICVVPDKASYVKILDGCAKQIPAERLAFLKTLQQAFVPTDRGELRLYCAASEAEALDQTVRGVAQDAYRYNSHGLWEGIGHAFCGFCFGQSLTFMLEQQKQHTVTGAKAQQLVPDIKVWMSIAAEAAWAQVDTPTSRLVLLNAARFTNQERVKAWAMVDWLLRWRPELVPELERSRTNRVSADTEIEAEFTRRTKLDLVQLDKDWRDYWVRGAALRAAMTAPPKGDKAAVTAAQALATLVNQMRVDADIGPLGWMVGDSAAVTAAHQHLEAVAKAEAERKKNPGLELKNPEPPPGFGKAVLALPVKDAAAAVAQWATMPGARDTLLHPGRLLLGCSQGKLGCVLDLGEPETVFKSSLPACCPTNGQQNVAASARAADLGPVALAALAKRGIAPDAEVGLPLTLHFFRKLEPLEIMQVQVRATAGGGDVEGVNVCLQGEGDRSVAAPGCFAFVPLHPLPPGAVVKVRWEVPARMLPKGESLDVVAFTVRAAGK